MERVENGLFVSVDYKGTLQDGRVFDSSEGRQPLEIQMGEGQVIKGFEGALEGMALNEKKTFTLDPADAYGNRDEAYVHAFDKSELPEGMEPKVGLTVGLTTPAGQQIPARITEVDDKGITVDLNHPLAGETLTFEIEVVGISETATHQPGGCGDCGCGQK